MRGHLRAAMAARAVLVASVTGLAGACGSDVTDPPAEESNPLLAIGPPSISGGGECPAGLACRRATGRVNDYETRAPLQDVRVDVLDRSNDALIAQLLTDANGRYDTGHMIPFGTPLRVLLSREGYITKETVSNTTSYLVREGFDPGPDGAVHGAVRYRNGSFQYPLGGAMVETFAGGEPTGVPVATAVTDTLGQFSLTGLPVGDHTVRIRAPHFAESVRVWNLEAGHSTNAGVVLGLDVQEDLRFVLTWTAANRDLDLIVEQLDQKVLSPTTVSFRIDHANPGSCEAPPFACLDTDVRDASGPETVTTRNVIEQPLRVYVNNHTAWAQGLGPSENSLAASGARVDVYIGDTLIGSATVPDGLGRTWLAFTLATPIVQLTGFAQRFPQGFGWTVKP